MEKLNHFLFALLCVFVLTHLVHGQSQAGFISIDCGLPGNSTYTEDLTGINFVGDGSYVDTGIAMNVSADYMTDTLQGQLATVRSFPQGARNCYKVNVRAGTKYLIRTSFLYANYDDQNSVPAFDLHFGPNFWVSVDLPRVASIVHYEILHTHPSNQIQVCLINTGMGTPFISSLELRPLNNLTYATPSQSLSTFLRLDYGSQNNLTYRFNNDIYDRIWVPPVPIASWTTISTTLPINVQDSLSYIPPTVVMNTAATHINANGSMVFFWQANDNSTEYFVYLYFAEIQLLRANETREFNILLNGESFYNETFRPLNLTETVIYTPNSITGGQYSFSFVPTATSTLPPILNAIEIYSVIRFPQSETNQGDVDAIMNIKSLYGVTTRNWQGDPCVPRTFLWSGVNCSYNDNGPPRIISLDLSSSRLTGRIAPDISNLQMLEILDLSNNNLTGPVPDFLTQLPNLRVLNLARNNLSGAIPAILTQRSRDGSLTLSTEENPNLGTTAPSEGKKSSVVVPVVASVVGVVVLVLIIVLGVFFWRKKKGKQQGLVLGASTVRVEPHHVSQTEPRESNKRQYTYAEVEAMTDYCKTVLGEGGFGPVYYGRVDDKEVAVKMLSQKSGQGYQQFQAEVELLMRVHHRNLTSLVGYCIEGTNMCLIYEYMSKGNLGSILAGEKASVLTWDMRLQIAMDSAQGLEYLHNGCRPAMVHRDVKTTNILLNDTFHAKLADFGLSRMFPTEGTATHITTNVVGTPGYLDPEYYTTYRLNEKSDVYSFGIVILELITGRPVISNSHEKSHISQWVEFMLSQGDINTIVDPRLAGRYDVNSVWKAVEVAMSCVSHHSTNRPTMSLVVTELKECLAMEVARKEGNRAQSVSTSSFSSTFASELGPAAR